MLKSRPRQQHHRQRQQRLSQADSSTWYQFHQHFTSSFFEQNCFWSFFLLTVWLCNLLPKKILALKLLVKFWWDWPQNDSHAIGQLERLEESLKNSFDKIEYVFIMQCWSKNRAFDGFGESKFALNWLSFGLQPMYTTASASCL